ncbi:MAG: LON peptidase substrate-binding domain-containing protein [Pseudomonadota bacterium]
MNTQIALFPIPNVVAFPGATVPLHVFEPRYRTMVHEAVRDERMIGVTHTRKQIHAGQRKQTLEDSLASNQATYQPFDVFGAGRCEIVDLTEDGRIHALVHTAGRYRILEEVQTLPYRIVSAVEIEDDVTDNLAEDGDLQQRINNRLIGVARKHNAALLQVLEDDKWLAQSPSQYSFKVFQLVRFEADTLQEVLEMTNVTQRLRLIDAVLRSAT